MNAGKLLTWNVWKRPLAASLTTQVAFLGLGLHLGTVGVSLWQQWTLTFGQDPVFVSAVCVVLSLGLWLGLGWRTQRATVQSMTTLVVYLSVLAFINPLWLDALTSLVGQLPLSSLETVTHKIAVACVLAVLGWTMISLVCSALIGQAVSLAHRFNMTDRQAIVSLILGAATGLQWNSLVFSPWLGLIIPCVMTTVVAGGICWRLARQNPTTGQPLLPPQASAAADESFVTLIRGLIACLVGALLACVVRQSNQLMPHSAFVIFVQTSGVLCGIALGLRTGSKAGLNDKACWGGLIAGATSAISLAFQPKMVELSLWLNATFTTVPSLVMARCLILMVMTLPFGFALAWIGDRQRAGAVSRFALWIAPLMWGATITTFALGGTFSLVSVMTVCVVSVLTCTAFLRVQLSGWRLTLASAVGMGSLAAIAASLPCWYWCDNPARTAKLLFSTPTFIAFRSGWKIDDLPYLDDIRMIDRREGNVGPMTLWRGRVAELYLREAGIPRSVVTKSSDLIPQFPAEVLQSVYSLAIADRPGRVLFLGLAAGVPLSTSLNFPIREAVCYEGDENLVAMVRGPIARETGFDPLNDDRVILRQVNPELALMTKPAEPFDVIMSNPPSSSITDGVALFTQEYYRRVSRQLSERGLFCQRFECIDYGPEPVLLVLKAMQAAFQKVVCVESSPGELLLFGANSESVFIPTDLATRLEASHVRQILARSAVDWSALLNQPAYDELALTEISQESRWWPNSTMHGMLAARVPFEVMRWGNKQQELQSVMAATRVTPAPYWVDETGQPKQLDQDVHLSRRSRLVEWLGDMNVSRELVRRLGEVEAQQKLVRENPDAHWWIYRKTLRKQLQERPRTAVQQVKAIDEKSWHPEDLHRRDYFLALGNAAREPKPTREQIAAVEKYLEPYDPLVSYFARQEIADLLARCGEDVDLEFAYRLHVIYFSPALDASVRNVATAIETLAKHSEIIPDASTRFDALNGMIQTLRVRWEVRQSIKETSSRKMLDDIDQSLIATERGVAAIDTLVASSNIDPQEWQARKQVLERLMLRPLRSYRSVIHARLTRGEAEAQSYFESAKKFDDDEDE